MRCQGTPGSGGGTSFVATYYLDEKCSSDQVVKSSELNTNQCYNSVNSSPWPTLFQCEPQPHPHPAPPPGPSPPPGPAPAPGPDAWLRGELAALEAWHAAHVGDASAWHHRGRVAARLAALWRFEAGGDAAGDAAGGRRDAGQLGIDADGAGASDGDDGDGGGGGDGGGAGAGGAGGAHPGGGGAPGGAPAAAARAAERLWRHELRLAAVLTARYPGRGEKRRCGTRREPTARCTCSVVTGTATGPNWGTLATSGPRPRPFLRGRWSAAVPSW